MTPTEPISGELFSFTEDLINSETPVKIRVTGNSMYPSLRDGDIVTIRKEAVEQLRRGDIVGIKSSGKWVAHRLLNKQTHQGALLLRTKGDCCRRPDPVSESSRYVGKVTSFSRGGRVCNLDKIRYRLAGSFIARFSVFTTPLFQLVLRSGIYVKKFRDGFSRIIESLRFVSRGSKKQVRTSIVLSVLQGMAPFLTIYLIKLLIDSISASGEKLQDPEALRKLWILLILTGLTFLVNALLGIFGGLTRERLSQSVTRNIYRLLHEKHTTLGLAFLEDPIHQDQIHRAGQEAAFRPVKLIQSGIILIQSVISCVVISVFILMTQGYLLGLLLIALIPGFLVRIRFTTLFYHYRRNNSKEEREGHYYHRILTGRPFAKELRLFNLGEYFRSRFEKIQRRLDEQRNQLFRRRAVAEIMAQGFAIALIFISFGLVISMALRGSLSVGSVVLFFMVIQRGFSVLSTLFQSVAGLSEDTVFLRDFLEFMQLPATTVRSKSDCTIQPLRKEIRIDRVSFCYPSSDRKALDSVSMTIPFGKTVALVGPNGSGKTTLVKLLCGFYPPSEGSLYFDDTDIAACSPGASLEQITAVFQDFALYNLSAAENIRLGNVSSRQDQESLKEAARKAGIDDVLKDLPFGYDTPLGNLFDKGEELSIGQWQKMAIARAFYRNSAILILDEPTSALDSESETDLLKNITALVKDKTVLIISHRFSTIQWADIIYVLDHGSVVESGTHDQLMALQGRYYTMFESSRVRVFS
ncbi:MAG: signal peptidase I [Bacteroidales bacterium]|nr:signal peptidase I [Bacteroidales bacterium]